MWEDSRLDNEIELRWDRDEMLLMKEECMCGVLVVISGIEVNVLEMIAILKLEFKSVSGIDGGKKCSLNGISSLLFL